MQSLSVLDLNYFNEDSFNELIVKISDCMKLTNGLINYHQKLAKL